MKTNKSSWLKNRKISNTKLTTKYSGEASENKQKSKKFSLCHKFKFSNPNRWATDGKNHRYFKLKLFDLAEFIV